jgi:uncharacterized protein (DUF1015 family)
MAEVLPFKGVLYNVPRISDVAGGDLVAPPYDIITPEYQDELYRKSPYNVVRIDFGKEQDGDNSAENKYTRARSYLDQWLRDHILVASGKPCFYSYEISYRMGTEDRKLRGFLGLVKLEELGKGNIHPHECTHSSPKRDRLDLMRVCRANISPIFSLYSGRGTAIPEVLARTNEAVPHIEARDMDGWVHRLWEITDESAIGKVRKGLREKAVFIADGHHRYETALEYQKERRAAGGGDRPMPYDYVMMFLADMADEGLTILPTHRLVHDVPADLFDRLSAHFTIQKMTGFDIAATLAGMNRVMGLYTGDRDGWHLLKYRDTDLPALPAALRDLDVSVLHELVLGRLLKSSAVTYEMDVAKCLELVRSGRFGAAFFLNPTRVDEVERVALASLRMPPKSTYFYPKLLTGLVLNLFDITF